MHVRIYGCERTDVTGKRKMYDDELYSSLACRPCILLLISCCLQVRNVETSRHHCWRHSYFRVVCIFVRCLLSPSPFLAATGAQCSAVPCYSHHGVLTGCLSKDHAGISVMEVQSFLDAWSCAVMEEQHLWHVCCGVNLTKASIQTPWTSNIALRIHCRPPKQEL